MSSNDPRPYLVRIKKGFIAVHEGTTDKEITDKATVKKINELLKQRRKAGQDLSKLVAQTGGIIASVHHATRTLGAGD